MKRTVPFTKTITFRTMIAEITNIEVTHDLKLKSEHEVNGDILVDGTYKMTDASQIEEEFHYKLPFTIELDSKYDTSNLDIVISDFYFEIINEEDLKVNVEIEMNGLKEKEIEIISSKISLDEPEMLDINDETEELVRHDDLESYPIPMEIENEIQKMETTNPLNKLEEEIKEDLNFNNEIVSTPKVQKQTIEPPTNVSSIFSSISSGDETFSTYYVYIVRENDTVEAIMDKYKTTREELSNYNDLDDVKVGSKLIIPCPNNE